MHPRNAVDLMLAWRSPAQEDKEAEDSDEEGEGGEGKQSKRKRKLESRLKIAELKQTCERPEVVEVWDVTAQDPRLLVYLKVRECAWHGEGAGVVANGGMLY